MQTPGSEDDAIDIDEDDDRELDDDDEGMSFNYLMQVQYTDHRHKGRIMRTTTLITMPNLPMVGRQMQPTLTQVTY